MQNTRDEEPLRTALVAIRREGSGGHTRRNAVPPERFHVDELPRNSREDAEHGGRQGEVVDLLRSDEEHRLVHRFDPQRERVEGTVDETQQPRGQRRVTGDDLCDLRGGHARLRERLREPRVDHR